METKNPPNATGFVKKSSTRNKKRSFKRKFDRKQACSAPACNDNAENIDWFVGCLMFVFLNVALREMFSTTDAE
ncbi:hypothetical protein [Xylanibacter rodentium]|uniref:hypothetical protein n=1 Tax=Xylanibacter rodentium TaxID=2736289 RepID=UPI000F4701DC|nr:hypothetical protein [Xylanibacter rodentium]ROT15341.1 hypothetical protein EEL51_13880 [Muribaculaceae bacterium Isolate-110 (HZI)]